MTYGDGVGDININELLEFHRAHGRKATVTATQPPGRFGALRVGEDGEVGGFDEKPVGDGGWINGGFFVLEPEVCDLIASDATTWEQEPMRKLAVSGELHAYRHHGFWQPMDTLRDKQLLESLWRSGNAPWRIWQK
jgi:glucose-1-phosphate cytidylyltransferase